MIIGINSWMWINSWCSRSFSCLHYSVKEWFPMISLNLWTLFCSKVRYRPSYNFKGHCTFRIHNQGCFCFLSFNCMSSVWCLFFLWCFRALWHSRSVLLITLQRKGEVAATHWIIYLRLHKNSTANQTEIDPLIYGVLILYHPLSPLRLCVG